MEHRRETRGPSSAVLLGLFNCKAPGLQHGHQEPKEVLLGVLTATPRGLWSANGTEIISETG